MVQITKSPDFSTLHIVIASPVTYREATTFRKYIEPEIDGRVKLVLIDGRRERVYSQDVRDKFLEVIADLAERAARNECKLAMVVNSGSLLGGAVFAMIRDVWPTCYRIRCIAFARDTPRPFDEALPRDFAFDVDREWLRGCYDAEPAVVDYSM